MVNYGNYQRQPAAPHLPWHHSNGTSGNTNGAGFAQAAHDLCKHLFPELTCDSPHYAPADFRVMFNSGNALRAWAFGRNLLRNVSAENVAQNLSVHANIVAFIKDLPEMKDYQHSFDLLDLFMAWFISKEDPHCASEILMDSLANIPNDSLESMKLSGRPLGGPMQDQVTTHLAAHLDGNPDRSVAEFRKAYPDSGDVQKWLDTVEAKLPH